MFKKEEIIENKYDCPKCGKEIDANDPKNQIPKKICYQCPSCNNLTRKCDALRLMEKKDGIKRWSLINSLKDGFDPFTGEKLHEKDVGNGWTQLVK
jgi:DNA-directed RNA polymerase subunit RPC12/RpoP